MTDQIERLRTAAEQVFRSRPVLFAYVFGSQATGRARPDSDVDVAVVFAETDDPLGLLLRLQVELHDASGLPGIELTSLADVSLTFRGRVVTEGVVIYSADDPARIRYEGTALKLHHEFEIHADEMRRAYIRNVAQGRA